MGSSFFAKSRNDVCLISSNLKRIDVLVQISFLQTEFDLIELI